jgi:hypothetical protein
MSKKKRTPGRTKSKPVQTKGNYKRNPIDLAEADLVTCVDLKNTDLKDPSDRTAQPKEVFHGIYASQLLGTLFGIYGKFYTDDQKKKGCCLVKGVYLKLINYKGIINIGFTTPKMTIKLTDNVINFNVQGLKNISEMEIIFDEPIEVERGSFKRITFNRIAMALPGFEPDLSSQSSINKLSVPKTSAVPNMPYFDTEFHYRDGIDYYDQVLRPGMYGYKAPTIGTASSTQQEIFSLRCIQSNVNLVYY